jgi:hypothetical protein
MFSFYSIADYEYHADIAFKQGHNDVNVLTPSVIAIEVFLTWLK